MSGVQMEQDTATTWKKIRNKNSNENSHTPPPQTNQKKNARANMVLNHHHHHNTPYPIDNGLHKVMHDGVVIVVAAIQVLQRRVCAQSLQQMPATLPTKLSATTTAGDFFLGTHRLVVAGWITQEQFVVGMSVKRKTKNVKRKT
jgi:hypothetical protein